MVGSDEKEALLTAFLPITLEEMSAIRLMNRIDTKFLLSMDDLKRLLRFATGDYLVQEVGGERDIDYHTVYLDTPAQDMYLTHLHGRSVREKIRVRTYVASNLSFLEIKNKNNKGRTDKKRIKVGSLDTLPEDGASGFLKQYALYGLEQLTPQLENNFKRITLVNKARTERLTIDCGICFHNIRNGNTCCLDNVAVVELKRDGRVFSPISRVLNEMHVHPSSFSKYCIGCALTNNRLKQNRLKPKIRRVMKLNGSPINSN